MSTATKRHINRIKLIPRSGRRLHAKSAPPFTAENRPKGGRPKGRQNKVTIALREAILLAGKNVGLDGHGKKGLTGYLMFLALGYPKTYAKLLERVLPMTMNLEQAKPFEHEHRHTQDSVDDLLPMLRARGLPLPPALIDLSPNSPDLDDVDADTTHEEDD